jgi:hypothetical protein
VYKLLGRDSYSLASSKTVIPAKAGIHCATDLHIGHELPISLLLQNAEMLTSEGRKAEAC